MRLTHIMIMTTYNCSGQTPMLRTMYIGKRMPLVWDPTKLCLFICSKEIKSYFLKMDISSIKKESLWILHEVGRLNLIFIQIQFHYSTVDFLVLGISIRAASWIPCNIFPTLMSKHLQSNCV